MVNTSFERHDAASVVSKLPIELDVKMNSMEEESSFEVLETSDCMPTTSMVLGTKEQEDQSAAEVKPLNVSDNPETQSIVKVKLLFYNKSLFDYNQNW